MKLRKNNKKGFTIVELVIVIGVIGILSAILIPTFVSLNGQAKDAGLSIGLVLAGIVIALGGFTGCGINPSRSFSPMLFNAIMPICNEL